MPLPNFFPEEYEKHCWNMLSSILAVMLVEFVSSAAGAPLRSALRSANAHYTTDWNATLKPQGTHNNISVGPTQVSLSPLNFYTSAGLVKFHPGADGYFSTTTALNRSTGEIVFQLPNISQVWHVPGSTPGLLLGYRNQGLYTNYSIFGIDEASGAFLWSITDVYTLSFSPTGLPFLPVDDNQNIIVAGAGASGSQSGFVYKVNARTGNIIYNASQSYFGAISTPMLCPSGSGAMGDIAVSWTGEYVLGINITDKAHVNVYGKGVVWAEQFQRNVKISGCGVNSTTGAPLVLLQGSDGHLMTMDVATGHAGVNILVGRRANPPTFITPDGLSVCVGSRNFNVFACYDVNTGNKTWSKLYPYSPQWPKFTMSADGKLLLESWIGHNKKIYYEAHDVATGKQLWNVTTPALASPVWYNDFKVRDLGHMLVQDAVGGFQAGFTGTGSGSVSLSSASPHVVRVSGFPAGLSFESLLYSEEERAFYFTGGSRGYKVSLK